MEWRYSLRPDLRDRRLTVVVYLSRGAVYEAKAHKHLLCTRLVSIRLNCPPFLFLAHATIFRIHIGLEFIGGSCRKDANGDRPPACTQVPTAKRSGPSTGVA